MARNKRTGTGSDTPDTGNLPPVSSPVASYRLTCRLDSAGIWTVVHLGKEGTLVQIMHSSAVQQFTQRKESIYE